MLLTSQKERNFGARLIRRHGDCVALQVNWKKPVWKMKFGVGLVVKTGDLGSNGSSSVLQSDELVL